MADQDPYPEETKRVLGAVTEAIAGLDGPIVRMTDREYERTEHQNKGMSYGLPCRPVYGPASAVLRGHLHQDRDGQWRAVNLNLETVGFAQTPFLAAQLLAPYAVATSPVTNQHRDIASIILGEFLSAETEKAKNAITVLADMLSVYFFGQNRAAAAEFLQLCRPQPESQSGNGN